VECAGKGRQLCSKAQLCPAGQPFDGGFAGSSATFVPVTDGGAGADEWVQYGASSSTPCILHSVTYSPDPHPCGPNHPDPVPHPDAATCDISVGPQVIGLYCCGVPTPAPTPLPSPAPTPVPSPEPLDPAASTMSSLEFDPSGASAVSGVLAASVTAMMIALLL
jgi:hypothetical protein